MPATWDSATAIGVTLSGGDLVATNTGTNSTNQGAHVAAALGQTSGKYYFEANFTTMTGGNNYGIGVGTPTSPYNTMGGNATQGAMVFKSGNMYSNGSPLGNITGAWTAGQNIALAVDLDNRRFWVRQPPSGNWNGSATNNPATNVGGIVIPTGTMVPFVTFGGTSGAPGNVIRANFGASAFIGAVPSGFIAGFPTAAAAAAQYAVSVIT